MSTRPLDELVADLRSTDFNRRALALAELVQRGRAATPALLALVDQPDLNAADAEAAANLRAQAVRGLAAIADPACADVFARLLADADERIRAFAAQGLARLRDPRALDALLRTLDDFPDLLREPDTPATDGLIELGPPALAKVAPLLDAPDPMTRARAFLVVREVLCARPETGDWNALWLQLGSYVARDTGPAREDAARQWRDWIARHFPAG